LSIIECKKCEYSVDGIAFPFPETVEAKLGDKRERERERERERAEQEGDERGNGGALPSSSTKTTTATLAGRQEQRSNNPV